MQVFFIKIHALLYSVLPNDGCITSISIFRGQKHLVTPDSPSPLMGEGEPNLPPQGGKELPSLLLSFPANVSGESRPNVSVCMKRWIPASGRFPTNLEARRFSADSGNGISSGYPSVTLPRRCSVAAMTREETPE